MDPLAHTLVGAALARTRLARGVPFATTTLIAAANLPDIDVLSYLGGEDAALAYRRGVTHGPLGFVLLPLLLVGVLAVVARRRHAGGEPVPLGRLAALAWLGALTHPLLDWLNVYGVRLLSPFSGRWFYGDALFIVDPWFWLILGVAVFLVRDPTHPALTLWIPAAGAATYFLASRPAPWWALPLWGATVGAAILARAVRRDALRRRRETIAAAAIAIWLVYLGVSIAAARTARHAVERALAARGVAPVERMMVAPVAIDPLPRDVVVQVPEGYRFGRYSLATGELALETDLEPKPPATLAVDAALASPAVRGFVGWARFPFVRVERQDGDVIVHVLDGRYARRLPSAGRGFGTATVVVAEPPSNGVRPPADPER